MDELWRQSIKQSLMPWQLSGMLRIVGLLNLGILAASVVAFVYDPFIWVATTLIVLNAPAVAIFTVRSVRRNRQTIRNIDRLHAQIKALDEGVGDQLRKDEKDNG